MTVPAKAVAAVLLAAVTALAAGCGGTEESSAMSGGRSGSPAAVSDAAPPPVPPCPELEAATPRSDGLPPLRLPCLGKGPAVRLSDLRGTPLVVNVWAAWCTNCDREMPLFAAAAKRAGDRLRMLGVHFKAPRSHALRSQADFGVPFASIHDEDGDRVVRALEAYAPPQTFFVDASGRVTHREVGEIASMRELRSLLRTHLGVAL